MRELPYFLLQAVTALQVVCIFLAPVLILARFYMGWAQKGSLKARKVVTVLAVACGLFALSYLAFYYIVWPTMMNQSS